MLHVAAAPRIRLIVCDVDVELTAALAGGLGLLTGALGVAAFWYSERVQRGGGRARPGADEPEDGSSGVLPDGLTRILSVLPGAAFVVGADGSVLRASSLSITLGIVHGDRVAVPALDALVAQVRRDGVIRELDLELPRPPLQAAMLQVRARVAPLSSATTLVLVEDVSEAIRVDAVRRDFVANVSHELKTPVGALSLLAEAVQAASDEPDSVRRFAGRMQAESQRLTNLVNDLIDLSRLQGGEQPADAHPVAVVRLVAEAVEATRLIAQAREIEVVVGAVPAVSVSGDESSLVMALRNLLTNAVAYSPPRTKVAVSSRAVAAEPDGLVEISVTDQGIGIPERRAVPHLRAVLPRRPGPVAGDRRHRPRSVHRQARLREPRRRVHGVVGARRGVDVHVAPAGPGHAGAAGAARPVEPAGGAAGRGEGGCRVTRVLVVEDEESFSDALSFMLRKEGFEVAIASTGTDAVAQFDRSGADLVLLDLMLPGMPGTEVCRVLRQRSTVPIIMVTAKDGEIDKVVGLELGADDYVTKPFSSRELVARIRAVLRRQGEPEELLPATLEVGPVRMDIDRHVVAVRGATIALPLKEFELLEMLLRNAGRVLTRGQLIDRVWGSDYVGDGKTLDVHVKRLRAKIEADPAAPTHLTTVRGLGYKYEA